MFIIDDGNDNFCLATKISEKPNHELPTTSNSKKGNWKVLFSGRKRQTIHFASSLSRRTKHFRCFFFYHSLESVIIHCRDIHATAHNIRAHLASDCFSCDNLKLYPMQNDTPRKQRQPICIMCASPKSRFNSWNGFDCLHVIMSIWMNLKFLQCYIIPMDIFGLLFFFVFSSAFFARHYTFVSSVLSFVFFLSFSYLTLSFLLCISNEKHLSIFTDLAIIYIVDFMGPIDKKKVSWGFLCKWCGYMTAAYAFQLISLNKSLMNN